MQEGKYKRGDIVEYGTNQFGYISGVRLTDVGHQYYEYYVGYRWVLEKDIKGRLFREDRKV